MAVPIPLERSEVTLGRALDADIRVNDSRADVEHELVEEPCSRTPRRSPTQVIRRPVTRIHERERADVADPSGLVVQLTAGPRVDAQERVEVIVLRKHEKDRHSGRA